ncbi:hypothetical protein ART_2513 [Arthrobacter sp. PAMC 25486]|uniref:glycerophosphodiester phosphodiesterase n=1 Tax=Arthrobacter sp. PAMC 25486 TaxID=1494608 RepID=UPI000536282F|nr:glycerophosphodiester phosphodiesterase family protein [Arthrobacter sp. PAMC 25486]AIY02112.1 hypothetical protein ART_2513 [Arthrobacter sp. PAMC 25486]
MTVQIFAHRGSSGAYAEHTRAAYLQALADGADGVECDLHLTGDGHLVLLHDETVDRTSNGSGPVAEMTLAQLRMLDFSSWHGAAIPPEFGSQTDQLLTLPELLEILADAQRNIGLAIEFKYAANFDPALVDAALETLRGHGWTPEPSTAGNVELSFMSFHPAAVKYLAQRVSPAQLCQLLEIVGSEESAEQGQRHQMMDDGVAHLAGPGVEYLREHPGDVARWVSAGRVLRVWTVNTAAELQLCLGAGVAQVTTNVPREIREMLAARL